MSIGGAGETTNLSDDSTGAQAAALARCQALLSEMPYAGALGPRIPINPPDICDPHVIVPAQIDAANRQIALVGRQTALADGLRLIERLLTSAVADGRVAPPIVMVALDRLETELVRITMEALGLPVGLSESKEGHR